MKRIQSFFLLDSGSCHWSVINVNVPSSFGSTGSGRHSFVVLRPPDTPWKLYFYLFHRILHHSLFSSVLPLSQKRNTETKTFWFIEDHGSGLRELAPVYKWHLALECCLHPVFFRLCLKEQYYCPPPVKSVSHLNKLYSTCEARGCAPRVSELIAQIFLSLGS